ncbi:transposase [Tenacibaculum finnmarkense]|uniref:transposase n=1 Tax=Tenacibaculum finnmarkense TaxID=2781243 RepID=UPI00187B8293|nr:transposase [Tenacibaculum finnmarkense]MBE7646895.1 hypothetical protein [Tenacibaculum finnmarkense genomovar ulcerans]
MTKFKGKYSIESNRLKGWDYGSNAIYFVTICCKNKECFFGDIINGKMILSEIGKIVETQWIKTFEMRPDMNLQTGEYIVMPNHFHAIITIGENSYNTTNKRIANPSNKFGSQSKNLASIIRGFKTGVTVNARKTTVNFSWQPNYYDHIIRNNKAYHNISNYIINNPSKWNEDTFHQTK